MGNDAGNGPNRRRKRRPNQKSRNRNERKNQNPANRKSPPQGKQADIQKKTPDTAPKSGTAHLKSISSLERLRDRVDVAALELRRLREENVALSERLQMLETSAHKPVRPSFFSAEHDPEVLRRKINNYIEAIDRYLESESKQP